MLRTYLYDWTTLSATFVALALALGGCPPPEDNPDADADTREGIPDTAPDTRPETDADTGGDAVDVSDTMDASDTMPDDATDTRDGGDVDPSGGELVLAVATADFANSKARVRTVSDFSTGQTVAAKDYQSTDVVVDNEGSTLYVLDRSNDEIIEFTSAADANLTEEGTYAMPSGGENPQDIEIVPGADRAFVSSYKSSDGFEFDGSRSVVNRIDLGQFGTGGPEGDDSPEAADIVIEEGYAYFVLQLLDRTDMFAANENSKLAGWDLGDQSFVDFDTSASGTQALDLEGKNAFTGIRKKPDGTWTVGLVADSRTIGGEIVELQQESDGRLSVGATVTTETALDGNLRDYVWTGSDTGVAALAKGGDVKYVTFDVSGSSVQTSEMRRYSGFSAELCRTPDRSEVWIADKPMSASETTFAGYDPSTGSKLSKSGPSVTGGAPSCTFLEVTN